MIEHKAFQIKDRRGARKTEDKIASAESVNKVVNGFLKENPGIDIKSVNNSTMIGTESGIMVSVLYENNGIVPGVAKTAKVTKGK